jgi:hypothetical protein
MEKISSIGLLFILIVLVSLQANSQIKSSATQTVTFAFSHSGQRVLNALTTLSSNSASLSSSETTTLQNSLNKMSVKVTIAETPTQTTAVSKNTSDVHMDLRSVLQTRNSAATPTVVTVTE